MSLLCLIQELYKYFVKGQSPGDAYVHQLPFNLHHKFNSTTLTGRANVAKATLALVSVATLGAYFVAPSVVEAFAGTPTEAPVKRKESGDTAVPTNV